MPPESTAAGVWGGKPPASSPAAICGSRCRPIRKTSVPSAASAAQREKSGVSLSFGGMAYCVFHSLALSYAESVRELECLTGKEYGSVNIIGGGCKNGLLNEMTARETGKTVVAGPAEATAMGNLLMQMIGTGEIRDLAAGREIIKRSTDIREVK